MLSSSLGKVPNDTAAGHSSLSPTLLPLRTSASPPSHPCLGHLPAPLSQPSFHFPNQPPLSNACLPRLALLPFCQSLPLPPPISSLVLGYRRVQAISSVFPSSLGGHFGEDGYVYGMDCGDGFSGVYLSPNSLSCIH